MQAPAAQIDGTLPLPPEEMRAMVGTTDPGLFENPTGGPVFPGLPPGSYPTVLDFGCGCGRLARQLIQQQPPPVRYVGVDLHPGMIKWCSENLSPVAPGFEFHHHDVRYDGFNPGADKPMHAPLPVGDHEFSLVTAISVFTHLTESQTVPYLHEMGRVLAPGGTFLSSWFLFDKRDFPMMQPEQNTLFINEWDVRNAVIYDSRWVRERATEAGLVLVHASPPEVRGHQWTLMLQPAGPGVQEVELPDDDADRGRRPPPAMPSGAPEIGL